MLITRDAAASPHGYRVQGYPWSGRVSIAGERAALTAFLENDPTPGPPYKTGRGGGRLVMILAHIGIYPPPAGRRDGWTAKLHTLKPRYDAIC
jgi:hypothetical protein